MLYKKGITNVDIFYVAWIIMEIHLCIANSNASVYSISIVSYIALALFILKIFLKPRYSIRNLFIMLLMLVIGAICAWKGADMRVLWLSIVMIASKDVDFNRLMKYSFRTMLLCCIVFFIMYITGVTEGNLTYSDKGIRMGLGLGHPNMLAAYYAMLMTHFIYLKYKKIRLYHIALFAIGAVVIYCITKSSTGIVVAIVTLFIAFLLKFFSNKRFNEKAISIGLFLGIVIFTFIPIIYSDAFSTFDTLITGRFHQAHFYYEKYGISLFGNDISYDLNKWNTDNILDIGYVRMLINNGVIYYLTIVFGYIFVIREAALKDNRAILVLCGSYVVYMYTENVATYIFMNPSILLIIPFIFRKSWASIQNRVIDERVLSNERVYEARIHT